MSQGVPRRGIGIGGRRRKQHLDDVRHVVSSQHHRRMDLATEPASYDRFLANARPAASGFVVDVSATAGGRSCTDDDDDDGVILHAFLLDE